MPAADRLPLGVRALRIFGSGLLALSPATRWIPAACWMSLTFILSMQQFGGSGTSSVLWGITSNGYHCFEYGVLALCLCLFAPRELGWPRLRARETVFVVGFVVLYGLSDEIHQLYVPTRTSSGLDLFSDFTGAWLATRAVARAGGVDYDARALVRIVLLGIPLCLGCAALANWGGDWFPWLVWS
ncbi:MAG: VanZ family protein [Planctomycetes bacterium]|nr:VanZ family protein [Planctomycetota bacterium]